MTSIVLHVGGQVGSAAQRTLSLNSSQEATLADTRKHYLTELTRVPLLIIDDLGMRKLPHTAADDLLELVMRRYERASTVLTSNRPVEDAQHAAVALLPDEIGVLAFVSRLGTPRWHHMTQEICHCLNRRARVSLCQRVGIASRFHQSSLHKPRRIFPTLVNVWIAHLT